MEYSTYEGLLAIVLESIEEAVGVSEEDLLSIGETPSFDSEFDPGITIEVDFDHPQFMLDYYRSSRVSLSCNVADNKAEMRLFLGTDCTNPLLANEFLERYMETTRYKSIWEPCQSAERGYGLSLSSRFEFRDDNDLLSEFIQRLSLFNEERFTNELRPFIHYFEDPSN